MASLSDRRRRTNYDDIFAVTFSATYFLTAILYPFVLAALVGGREAGGFVAAFAMVFSLIGAVILFLKAVILAAFTFYPLFWTASMVTPTRYAFVFCASVSAALSAFLALAMNIDIYPLQVSFLNGSWDQPILLGFVAMIVAMIIASVQMLIGAAND